MKVWAIRQKGTDKYLQLHRSSNTFYTTSNKPRIRFHPTKRGAVNTLTAWLQGKITWRRAPSTYDAFNGEYDGGEVIMEYDKKADRKREEMEIVEFDITEVSTSQLKSK